LKFLIGSDKFNSGLLVDFLFLFFFW
jgi:hypothetical protein